MGKHYPMNSWWVIATTKEVTDVPISRKLLDQRVVLARSKGGIFALDDRCAHRRAPLSCGRLIDDQIECSYHGLRFDRSGACTRVPTQEEVSGNLRVRSYPVQERGPFVWIWMGNAQEADCSLLPDIPPSTDTMPFCIAGYMELGCNYVLLLENMMDLAHVPFLHRNYCESTFGPGSEQRVASDFARVTTHATERAISMTMVRPATKLEIRSMGLGVQDETRKTAKSVLALPSCWLQEVEILHLSASQDVIRRDVINTVSCVTPISPKRCHWWWNVTQDHGHGLAELWQAEYDAILKEDRDLLEALQISIDEDSRAQDARDQLVRADRTIIDIRIALQRMLDAQQ